MSDLESKTTIKDLLLFVHKDLSEFSNKKDYTKKDNDRLNELTGVIQILWDFAKEMEDNLIYKIADNLNYAIYHINNFKEELGLNGAKENIDKLK